MTSSWSGALETKALGTYLRPLSGKLSEIFPTTLNYNGCLFHVEVSIFITSSLRSSWTKPWSPLKNTRLGNQVARNFEWHRRDDYNICGLHNMLSCRVEKSIAW
jgi:hypothetical protein